ncbi:MAG: hypothetical protein ACR2GX_02325 [Candidatus Dormibacteria bacterium]
MRRILIALGAALLATVASLHGALACGALGAPNGSVRLGQATTFVAWKAGVEHYLTSFSY